MVGGGESLGLLSDFEVAGKVIVFFSKNRVFCLKRCVSIVFFRVLDNLSPFFRLYVHHILAQNSYLCTTN